MYTGYVKSINAQRRFGFIRGADGIEYFFHQDDVIDRLFDDFVRDFENKLKIKVSFKIAESNKGPRAADVCRILIL